MIEKLEMTLVALACVFAMCCLVFAMADMLTVECGMCGAHVWEWWPMRSDSGNWFNACELCAEAA